MRQPTKTVLAMLRNAFPKGMRVKLLSMDDPQAPPAGTEGTIIGVDDMGSILVHWDNGSSLSIIPEAGDQIEKMKTDG